MSASFIPSYRGGKLAVVNGYTFSLLRTNKNNFNSYYVCTEKEKKSCKIALTLNHGVIVKCNGEHTHLPSPDKIKKRIFCETLKQRCKNDSATPFTIYKQELAKELASTPGVPSYLPGREAAIRMQYRATAPKKPKYTSSQKKDNRTLVVLDQSLYKMEFVSSLKGGRLLILDGYIFKRCRNGVSSTYWECSTKRCHAVASLSRNNNRLLRVGGSHNHDPPEANIRRKRFFHLLRVRITANPTESLSNIYREELEKFATTSDNKSNLPSEKAATGVMMKIREQVLHAANSTDKSIHSEPKDSNSDNPSPPKEDSSKLDAFIQRDKSKKIIPEVCLTIDVKRELAQADPYDPSLSPGPPCPQRATDPSTSTIEPLEAMTCDRLPANDVRTSSLNLQNEPDPEIEHRRPHTLPRPHPGPSNAATVPLQNMACEQSLLHGFYADHKAINRFLAHDVYAQSSYQHNRLPCMVRSEHPRLSSNYQCPITVPSQGIVSGRPPTLSNTNRSIPPIALSETTGCELLPRDIVNSSPSNYQNKQEPRTAHICNIRLPSMCSDSSNAATLFAEKICKRPTSDKAQRLIGENKSNPRIEQPSKLLRLLSSKPHSSSIAKIPFVSNSCHQYASTAINLICGSPSLPNSNPDLSSSTPPGERYTADKIGAVSLTNQNKQEPVDALRGHFSFRDNCLRRYSHESHHQITMNDTFCTANSHSRQLNACGQCNHEYSGEFQNHPTANPLFQPLNVSDQCQKDYSHQSPNPPADNPLFQSPVLIKDEVVYSEEEEVLL